MPLYLKIITELSELDGKNHPISIFLVKFPKRQQVNLKTSSLRYIKIIMPIIPIQTKIHLSFSSVFQRQIHSRL